MELEYAFTGKVWMYSGEGAWYFVTLPVKYAEEIKAVTAETGINHGFGSVKVTAQIGDAKWDTSIFPDSKSGSYLLPLKKDVRVKAKLVDGTAVNVIITIHAVS